MATTTIKEDKTNYIVFFDLDRTLIKAVSGTELARGAWKKGFLKWVDLVHALYLSVAYKFGLKDPVKIVNKMTEWVKGLPEEILNELCEEVYNEVLLPSLLEESVPEIKMHKEKGAKVVILSSSLVPICTSFASYLEFDDIICSRLEIIDGIMTGRPSGKLCFGDEKLSRLKDYCELNNSTPEESWYYGDANTDLPALNIVGFPVCVNPERKLLKIARKKGWKILYWSK
jgi:putative phosphoserine phosphatase / 1-acylglycerol-3-phosphate O-acyltransferase